MKPEKEKELLSQIKETEEQLFRARRESDSWNNGKYKHSHNALVSKIFVDSLDKKHKRLLQELNEINNHT